MAQPFPPPSARGGAYRAPAPKAGDVPRPVATPRPAPARQLKRPAVDVAAVERRQARAEYLRSLRELRGEAEKPAPARYVVPGLSLCCAEARVDPSACTCGGLIFCPKHSPQGRCTMQFSHD